MISKRIKRAGRSQGLGASPGTDLYLDLLKRCLTRYGFGEPQRPVPLPTAGIDDCVPTDLHGWLEQHNLQLVSRAKPTQDDRLTGKDWPTEAETMVGLARLDNVELAVRTVVTECVAGDLIETGVWRGGTTILMRGVLKALREQDRIVWVADSFAGLPKPDPERYPADEGDPLWRFHELAVSVDEVKVNFERYGLLDDQVRFLVGWFEDTLPAAPIEHLAVLRLDGDMYGSTIQALEALYPKLSPGGYCIIDDYGAVAACKRAVDDYRMQQEISEPISEIDWTGVYWRRGV
jgi:O-methyltransferase